MTKDAEIFIKLTEAERDRLLRDMADVKGEIVCKGDGDDVYRVHVERIGPKKELYCLAGTGPSIPPTESDLLGNFFIGGERYFFRTPVSVIKEFVTLRADQDVFHLQRRQNYRVKIPLNYRALFAILAHDGRPVKLSAEILDLSTGGCKAQVKATDPAMKEGQELKGMLLLAGRDAIEVKGIVRHQRSEPTAPGSKQSFGVEFVGMTPQFEAKLFAVTMDLHRQFFIRLNQKN